MLGAAGVASRAPVSAGAHYFGGCWATSALASAPEPFTLAHFRHWARGLILDNDEPWTLDPYQELFVADLFAGFKVSLLIVPEGNGKTTLLAGLALYHAQFRRTAYVPVAASSRDQAEWLYRQAEGFVFRSEMSRSFRCLEGYRRIRHDATGSRIQVFAADDRTGDGVIPTLAILDELHRHRNLALYRTWIGKLRKRGGQLAAISTAGEEASEFELERERLRQNASEIEREGSFVRAVKYHDGERVSVLHEYAVPENGDVDDLEQVKAANPFTGITLEYLREKKSLPGMTPSHWARFTCNVATRSVDCAIQETEWEAARVNEPIPIGVPVWAGLDVAWKRDTTALVPLYWRDSEYRQFGTATILEPPRNGNSLDPHRVEAALRELHERNPIATLVMDTSKAEQLASWVESELSIPVVDRQQTNPLAALDYSRFTEALREGWLLHDGDPGLRRHVLNAVARVLPLGDTRFDRPVSSQRAASEQPRRVIDALTAASMVHSVAVAEFAGETSGEPLVALI